MWFCNSRRALYACALLLILASAGRLEVVQAQTAPPKQKNVKTAASDSALKPLEIDIEGLKKILRGR